MSLKKYKNKIKLIEDIIDSQEVNPYNQFVNFYWWDFSDDDYWFDWNSPGGLDCDNCGKHYCRDYDECQSWDYIKPVELEWLIKWGKSGRIYFERVNLFGSYIDMDTIQIDNKQIMREKKIDLLFGLSKKKINKPTFGDLFKKR